MLRAIAFAVVIPTGFAGAAVALMRRIAERNARRLPARDEFVIADEAARLSPPGEDEPTFDAVFRRPD